MNINKLLGTVLIGQMLFASINIVAIGAKNQPAKTNSPVKTSITKFKLPGWQSIQEYDFPKLSFDKTTIEEFTKLYPNINNYEDANDNIRVYSYKLDNTSPFLSVKFGFEDNKLSWIDYFPSGKVNLTQVMDAWGAPLTNNTSISKYLNYYIFEDIIVTASKQSSDIYTFTQSGKIDIVSNNAKKINLKIPPLKDLITGRFDKLTPGISKNSNLKNLYTNIIESETNYGKKDNDDADYNVYLINQGLENTDYKSIELIFKNNLLSWINIIPKKLTLDQAIKVFNARYKVDKSNDKLNFYNYDKIILTVSKKSNIILNIGIVGWVNSKLRQVLPCWEQLDKASINELKIDSTKEEDFRRTFHDLLAEKQKDSDSTIYKVIEGISTTCYESIYIVFKNKKLNSIDLTLSKPIKISEVIKVYGDKYDLDDKSDKDLEYYTFNNVIVSVFKKTKIVNSIGLL